MVNANAASNYKAERRKEAEDGGSNRSISVTEECSNGVSTSRKKLVGG